MQFVSILHWAWLLNKFVFSVLRPVAVPRWGGGGHSPPNLAGPQVVARPPNLAYTLDTMWSIDSQKNE